MVSRDYLSTCSLCRSNCHGILYLHFNEMNLVLKHNSLEILCSDLLSVYTMYI